MTGHRSLKLATMVLCFVACSSRAAAQEATPTDDAFESANTLTETLNLKGHGGSLIVAGSNATVGSWSVGTTTSYIHFQLMSILPANVAAANVSKATLELYLSPLTSPTVAIDIYPVTSAWSDPAFLTTAEPALDPELQFKN